MKTTDRLMEFEQNFVAMILVDFLLKKKSQYFNDLKISYLIESLIDEMVRLTRYFVGTMIMMDYLFQKRF